MTTATDVSLDFERAAALHRAVSGRRVDAKLDVKTAVDSGLFKDMLSMLVGIGMLSPEQARALWEAVTGGTFVPLPPIPWPGSGLELDLYSVIRAKLDRARAGGGEIDASVEEVLVIIEAVVHTAEVVGHAIADAWHWLFG